MSKMRNGIRILLTAAALLLLAACTGDSEPASPGNASSTTDSGKSRKERYVVGSGILMEDITEFYFTYDSSSNPPEFQRYRFYMEDGTYMFGHETREGGHWPLTEEDITVSGTLELTEEDWEDFFGYLEGGRVEKRTDSAESGGRGPWLYLYWNGDRSKYQVFSFSSRKQQNAFEEYCIGLKAQAQEAEPAGTQPEPEAADAALYAPVLEELRRVLQNGYVFDTEYHYVPTGLMERVMYDEGQDASEKVGFALTDISGDGIPELLVGENTENYLTGKTYGLIYGCYSARDGEIVFTFEGYTRSSHGWLGDGRLFYLGSGGAANTLFGEARLRADGTELEWVDFYFSDIAEDGTSDLAYYHNNTGFYDVEHSERLDITSDAFLQLLEDYQNELQPLALEALCEPQDAAAYQIGSEGIEIFGGQYQNDHAGVVSNIWDQSTGIVFSFGIEDASFMGDASYEALSGRLTFEASDYQYGATVRGYAEKDGDGIRVTFTASDYEWIAAGDVYTLGRVQ